MADGYTPGGEIIANGLIEELLSMRETTAPSNLARVARFLESEDFASGFTAWIDQALDLLVPAMKKLALLPTIQIHGPNCISKLEVDRVIGRVPITKADQS